MLVSGDQASLIRGIMSLFVEDETTIRPEIRAVAK